uniref:CUB domain-containing protein n=1 Tax=Plectus sambesii TaxID=2011161 RepID=A0A914V9K1_9BILA
MPPAAEYERPYYNSTPRRCDEKNDHLTAHVLFDTRMSKIDDFCGSETPPQLMSTQTFLTLEFIAKSPISVRESSRSDKKYRFLLHYKFVRDLDMQDMKAARNPNKVCGFIFNSSQATNGTLWSPNYPGYYPRQTECDYVFHGNEHEVVRIYFTYFDVEGYSQCNDDTKSDFVIFSNYQTHDRTNRRYCGTMTPLGEAIMSESNYFRMIFKSNGIFDATGFFARYQFVKP